MGYVRRDQWERHYAQDRGFRRVGQTEKALLAEHVPAPLNGRALDVGCGVRHEVARVEWIRLWRSAYAEIVIPG